MWDTFFLDDHDEYLQIRYQEGYDPKDLLWENSIKENFAEDFAFAIEPSRNEDHRSHTLFGRFEESQQEELN